MKNNGSLQAGSGATVKNKRKSKVRIWLDYMRFYIMTWLMATGLIASSSACPICGQAGCPINIGQAAGLGAFSAGVLWIMRKAGLRKKVAQHAQIKKGDES